MPEYFKDPIHGLIRLCPLANKIINTPEFNRLREIKQLSATHYIYAGAKHARFEHSVGTYGLTYRYMRQLQERCPEVKITDRNVTLISIAGLLHDVGHCVMGHAFDHKIVPFLIQHASERDKIKLREVMEHEQRSVKMVKHLYSKYKWEEGWMTTEELKFVCDLISDSNCPKDPQRSWMWEIVSNSTSFLDTDKMDYLLRDNAAVGFGVPFQLDDILAFTSIKDGHIVYNTKLRPIIWNIFRSRFDMHQIVYQHPSCTLVEHFFCEILKHHAQELELTKALVSKDCAWESLVDPIFYKIRYDAYSKQFLQHVISHEYPPYDVVHDGVCVKSKKRDEVKVTKVLSFYIGFFPRRKNYFPKIPFLERGKVVYNQIPDPPKSINGLIRLYSTT